MNEDIVNTPLLPPESSSILNPIEPTLLDENINFLPLSPLVLSPEPEPLLAQTTSTALTSINSPVADLKTNEMNTQPTSTHLLFTQKDQLKTLIDKKIELFEQLKKIQETYDQTVKQISQVEAMEEISKKRSYSTNFFKQPSDSSEPIQKKGKLSLTDK
jgi:hypothetical protein